MPPLVSTLRSAPQNNLIVGPWSVEEIEFLRARYPLVLAGKTTAREIAHFLDRTRNSVIARANRMGLGERTAGWQAWSAVELAYLREQYPQIHTGKTTARRIAAALGRPLNAVLSQARRMGLCGSRTGRPSHSHQASVRP
ncbi:MAG: hypothetical protein ACJ8ED_02140 [Xanthobacteraceae bacterium]